MQYGTDHSVPTLMTEFGATQDQSDLTEIVAKADQHLLGWTEWAYTGNDKTSTSPDGQALVLDPAKPPRGANVERAKLKALAEVYPQVIAGTPVSYSFTGGVFHLTYRTARVSGAGRFPARCRGRRSPCRTSSSRTATACTFPARGSSRAATRRRCASRRCAAPKSSG